MSLPRVSSIETFTTVPDLHPRSRRESDASTRARKLTFNPLPEIWDPPLMGEQLQAVGAFTVPRWKRLQIVQVTAAVLACFFASGIVFGFAAIKPVLKAEGAYRHLCSVPDGLNDEEDTCVEMHLNLMFTVAAVATNVAALPSASSSKKSKTPPHLHCHPSRSDPTPYDQVTEETALLREEQFQQRADDVLSVLGTTNPDKQTRREEAVNRASGVWGVMHGRRAREQLCSAWFVLICLFTVVQMTRINFFVATVRAQYEHLLGSHGRAVAVNDFFDVALPVGGVLAVPMIGFVLDGVSTPVVLAGLVGCATVIGGLGMVSGMEWAAYANVVLFVVYRPFYYTAVSDYTAKVFGFETFGTVYGAIICLAGVLNFSQSGLDYMFEKTFEGNPVPVNALLLGLGLAIGIVLVVFVSWKAKRVKREVLEVEARGAFGGIYA
ncbi:hypothetical protein N0V88_004091 [Collariella sp. IMI 366227]|nr:hypothetical protein N0V88_004091 [Collariella sp. IMI 366227]